MCKRGAGAMRVLVHVRAGSCRVQEGVCHLPELEL